MENIFVGYIPVLGKTGELDGYHKYLLYQNASAESFYIRGGPEAREAHVGVSRSFWGNIVTETGPYVEGTVDYDLEGNHYRELIISADDLSDEFAIMRLEAQKLNSYSLQYHALFRNSNSVVDSVLLSAGLPLPKDDGVDAYWAPGSDVILTEKMHFPLIERQVNEGAYGFVEALSRGLIQVPECFPSDTPIQLTDGTIKSIKDIAIGDAVAAFSGVFGGRGGLEGKRVTRLFTNITDTWIELSNGLTVTPGHHFLDAEGEFRTIADILAMDGRIVLEDGSVAEMTGEYIHYTTETADLYEQAEGFVAQSEGGLALAPVYKKGWKTYNFEVEDYHTYVAGGVRVHNASVFTPTGLDLTIGQTYKSVNGNDYRVNADGSLTNVQTGHSSPASANPGKKYLSVGAAMFLAVNDNVSQLHGL